MSQQRLQDVRDTHALDVLYVKDFLQPNEATALFKALTAAKADGGEGLGVLGPRGGLHRSFCVGLRDGVCYDLRPWHSSGTCAALYDYGVKIARHLGLDRDFDYCVVQVFKDAKGHKTGMAAHTDDEQSDISPIVGLSLFEEPAATRPLDLVSGERLKAHRVAHRLDLAHGSLYALLPPTNSWWKHALPKRVATRVSITYRRAPRTRRVSFPKHPSEIVEISSDSEPEIIEIAYSDSDDDSVVDLTL